MSKLKCLIPFLMCFPLSLARAQPEATPSAPESPMIAALAQHVAKSDASAVKQFWNNVEKSHTPLIEAIPGDRDHVLATFLWRGDVGTRDVVLMAQVNGIEMLHDRASHLIRLGETDVWYRTHRLPTDAEFSYLLSVNPPNDAALGYLAATAKAVRATLAADPLNPLQYRILAGPVRSIARMPGVHQNPWLQSSNQALPALTEYTIHSAILTGSRERKLSVFKTPGDMRNPNLLILLDADTYTKSVPTPTIVSNLYSAGQIGPTVAVLVEEGDGNTWLEDHYFNDTYVSFLAEEVVPWAEKQFHFKAEHDRTAIGGDSIEGLTAAFAALRYPGVFGKVISQSGSFWVNNRDMDAGEPEWLARQFARVDRLNVFFCLDVGQTEFVRNDGDRIFLPFIPGETNLLASNRHLRDVLIAKGYRIKYLESYGGHEPLRWSRTLPELLIAAFSTQ